MQPPKRPRVRLPALPDSAWQRILAFLLGYRRGGTPPRRGVLFHAHEAFPLACASTRHLRIFRQCIAHLDATPSGDFLSPLARTDSRFRVRDPRQLRTVIRIIGAALDSLHLPIYDCSMEDAHWVVMEALMTYSSNLRNLSFVDSFQHQCRTPLSRQIQILSKLLPSVTSLQIFVVREVAKLDAMISQSLFCPESLTLHKIHPNVQTRLIDLLQAKGMRLISLCLSFEGAPQHVFPTFLQSLAGVVRKLPCLSHLELLRAPVRNPLDALQGPAITREESINKFDSVSKAINDIKSTLATSKPFTKLVVERLCPDLSAAIRLFKQCCDHRTEIEVYLHEVLLVSPAKPDDQVIPLSSPYFRATALHSSSWMVSDLPNSYFRKTEHIKISADQDCRGSLIERMFPQDGSQINPDMRSFRFLCEQSGLNIRSVYASVPVESVEKANAVLRILSEGLAYARNVTCLEISGDVLRYIGLHHSQLYAVVGQLKKLVELYVYDEPGYGHGRGAQIKNLPLLLRALWMNCRQLESFKFEFSSFGSASPPGSLEQALISLREFDRRLPGVETHNLGELLELSLWPQECRVGIG